VPLEPGQGLHLLQLNAWNDPVLDERRVLDENRVALAEQEAIAVRVREPLWVEPHRVKIEVATISASESEPPR